MLKHDAPRVFGVSAKDRGSLVRTWTLALRRQR